MNKEKQEEENIQTMGAPHKKQKIPIELVIAISVQEPEIWPFANNHPLLLNDKRMNNR